MFIFPVSQPTDNLVLIRRSLPLREIFTISHTPPASTCKGDKTSELFTPSMAEIIIFVDDFDSRRE